MFKISFMTEEQIIAVDTHVDLGHDAIMSLAATKPDIHFCDIWPLAKPILLILQSILFFKPKWSNILSILIKALDAQCPALPVQ